MEVGSRIHHSNNLMRSEMNGNNVYVKCKEDIWQTTADVFVKMYITLISD